MREKPYSQTRQSKIVAWKSSGKTNWYLSTLWLQKKKKFNPTAVFVSNNIFTFKQSLRKFLHSSLGTHTIAGKGSAIWEIIIQNLNNKCEETYLLCVPCCDIQAATEKSLLNQNTHICRHTHPLALSISLLHCVIKCSTIVQKNLIKPHWQTHKGNTTGQNMTANSWFQNIRRIWCIFWQSSFYTLAINTKK